MSSMIARGRNFLHVPSSISQVPRAPWVPKSRWRFYLSRQYSKIFKDFLSSKSKEVANLQDPLVTFPSHYSCAVFLQSFTKTSPPSYVTSTHTSYLSQTPQTCLCKNFLSGVNFSRLSEKKHIFDFFRDIYSVFGAFGRFFGCKIWFSKILSL